MRRGGAGGEGYALFRSFDGKCWGSWGEAGEVSGLQRTFWGGRISIAMCGDEPVKLSSRIVVMSILCQRPHTLMVVDISFSLSLSMLYL